MFLGIAILLVVTGKPMVGAASGDAYPPPTLSQIADLLETDLAERFLIEGHVPPKRRPPSDAVPFVSYNMPDNAYMTGMYLADQTYRWLAAQDPEAKRLAQDACTALHTLIAVTGKPGLFARAFMPWDMPYQDDGEWHKSADGKYRWRGDVSSDQVDGYMYGCSVYAAHLASEAEIKRMALDCVAICDHIENHGMHIEDVDNEPTQWGHYEPEYVKRREPMNALLWLQHLKIAAQLSGDPKQEERYRHYALDEGYAKIAADAHLAGGPGLDGRINFSDTVLIFLAYEPLLRLEKDPVLREMYLASLERSWESMRPLHNPFFTYLYMQATGKRDKAILNEVKDNLASFTFDIHWNSDTRETYAKRFQLDLTPQPKFPKPKRGEVVPYEWRSKTWSLLVQNPYNEMAQEVPRPDSGMEYTGLHWTISYWLGRAEGLLK